LSLIPALIGGKVRKIVLSESLTSLVNTIIIKYMIYLKGKQMCICRVGYGSLLVDRSGTFGYHFIDTDIFIPVI